MSLHDFRTKPASQWTYYVVDHLPTMANVFRYDTPEEAIQCYRSLDPSMQSAIGSSIGTHEMDLIHRRSNDTPVFVTASDRMETPVWRESKEAQDAIDLMLSKLNVQHELNSDLFGGHLPSVIVDLTRHRDTALDSYFNSSILYPDIPKEYRSAITEVFSIGHGWMKPDAFIRSLRAGQPKDQKEGVRDVFVDRLNIRYLDLKTMYFGQADISPREYLQLQEKTEHLLSPRTLARDLDTFFSTQGATISTLQNKSLSERLFVIQGQIANFQLNDYRKALGEVLLDPQTTPDVRQQATELYGRIMALTPREFMRPRLSDQIKAAAEKSASRPLKESPPLPEREEER